MDEKIRVDCSGEKEVGGGKAVSQADGCDDYFSCDYSGLHSYVSGLASGPGNLVRRQCSRCLVGLTAVCPVMVLGGSAYLCDSKAT